MGKQVDCVSIVLDERITHDSKGMQLVAESQLSYHQLSCICPIQAIDTIGTSHTILHSNWRFLAVSIVKEPRNPDDVFRYRFQDTNDILISAIRRIRSIPVT